MIHSTGRLFSRIRKTTCVLYYSMCIRSIFSTERCCSNSNCLPASCSNSCSCFCTYLFERLFKHLFVLYVCTVTVFRVLHINTKRCLNLHPKTTSVDYTITIQHVVGKKRPKNDQNDSLNSSNSKLLESKPKAGLR